MFKRGDIVKYKSPVFINKNDSYRLVLRDQDDPYVLLCPLNNGNELASRTLNGQWYVIVSDVFRGEI